MATPGPPAPGLSEDHKHRIEEEEGAGRFFLDFSFALLLCGGALLVLPLGHVGFAGACMPADADYVGIGLVALAGPVQLALLARAPSPA